MSAAAIVCRHDDDDGIVVERKSTLTFRLICRKRFQREAEAVASLTHPRIGAIYDLAESGDRRFLVLELGEGETLADRIAQGPVRLVGAGHPAAYERVQCSASDDGQRFLTHTLTEVPAGSIHILLNWKPRP
jgi:hypothetical protein